MGTSFVETPKLRFIERAGAKILQQYFAEDVPEYMRNKAAGEWRDVDTYVETSAPKFVDKDSRSDAAEPAA